MKLERAIKILAKKTHPIIEIINLRGKVMDNKESKKSKWNILKNFLSKTPKVLKYSFILILLVGVFYLGVISNISFKSQTKTTKLGLEDVGELVTQTCYVTVIKDNKTNRDFFKLFDIPFTESRQIFSYDVEVDASVDFSKITYTANEESSEIIIRLPHAKIYKSTPNLFSFKEYLDVESLFSRIDLEQQNEALKAIEEQAINDAKANGILEAADRNAKTLISGLIKSNDKYKEYKIIYEYIGG